MPNKRFVFLFFIGWWFLVSKSQTNETTIHFDNITAEQGLSMGSVSDITKDKNGYIWFATADGLNRFDGKNFKIFKHNKADNSTLSDSYITSIETFDNMLIVGNYEGSINLLDLTTYTAKAINFQEAKNNTVAPINSVTIFKNDLWIATAGNGLWKINLKSQKALEMPEFHGKAITNISVFNNQLYVLEGNTVWQYNTKGFAQKKNLPSSVNSITLFQNKWYYGTENGLFTDDEQVNFKYRYRGINNINALATSGNELWIGTFGAGLIRLDAHLNVQVFSHNPAKSKTIADNNIQAIFLDPEGLLWVGSFLGVSKYAPKNKLFNLVQDIKFNDKSLWLNTYCIYENSANKDLWLGTLNNGIVILDSQNNIKAHVEEIQAGSFGSKSIRCIYQYGENTYLIASRDAGLFSYNVKAKKFAHIVPNTLVRHIFKDSKGTIWLSTDKGMKIFNENEGNTAAYKSICDQTQSNVFYEALEDTKNNRLLFASFRGGLFILDRKTKTLRNITTDTKLTKGALSSNNLMCMRWFNQDTLLIGTYGGGLNILNMRDLSISVIDEQDGLVNNAVYGVLVDKHRGIWMSTNEGLTRLSLKDTSFKRFNTSHYLQNREFNEGAYLLSTSGKMYFGGVNGFNYFYPNTQVFNTNAPNLVLTELLGKYTTDKNGVSIRLPYLNTRLEIGFAALDYVNPGGIKYEYKLEGRDNDWQIPSNSNLAVYHQIQPGNYTFLVRARDEFSMWKVEKSLLQIQIPAPFWQKWWFIVLSALVLLSLGFLFFKIRARAVEKNYKTQLLDSELRALRSQMNPHFIFNSLNSIQYFILKKEPQEAYNYLSKFATLMRKILHNSRLKQISLQDEINWLDLYLELEKMRMDDNLDYRISTDNIDTAEVFVPTMLIQPFVENSIIHGLLPKNADRKLEIKFENHGLHFIKCTVTDNGIGRLESGKINENRKSKHTSAGISLTTKRLEVLTNTPGKSMISIKDLAQGVAVEIIMPKMQNH